MNDYFSLLFRGYYLLGAAVFLEQALVQLALRMLHAKK